MSDAVPPTAPPIPEKNGLSPLVIVALVAGALVMCICGVLIGRSLGTGNTAASPGETSPTDAPPANPTGLPPPPDAAPGILQPGWRMEDPAAIGSTVAVPRFDLIMVGYERGVDEALAEINALNQVAEEGTEFMRIRMQVTCDQPECDFLPGNFEIISSSGLIIQRRAVLFSVNDMLGPVEMLEGTTIEGDLYYEVPVNDPNLILRWDPGLGDDVFFDVRG